MSLRLPKDKRTKDGKPKYKNMPAHARSAKQERELAARLTPRSGAGEQKGDVRKKGVIRIEAKTTTKKSFSVTRKMIQTIEEAALNHGEAPAIIIEFTDEQGNPEMEIAVVPTYVVESIANG